MASVILALDIATTTGWAVMVNGVVEETGHFNLGKDIDYGLLNDILSELIDRWQPSHVITAKPTAGYNAIFKMAKILGAAELILQKNGLAFYRELTKDKKTKTGKTRKGFLDYPTDSHFKKEVLSKGKCEKQEIMDWAGIQQEDEADAAMFATYLYKTLSNENQ